ncbi:MAG: tRNA pseudouridine(13) synthase TruD [Gemmataceae bacterium]
MKLRTIPEDFQVEECTEVQPGERGPFGFYRLTKTGWTTLDALGQLQRRWKLDRRAIQYGGLKDRHARTVQYLTVYRGPNRSWTSERMSLDYLGQVDTPYSSEQIRANRFRLTLRDLGKAEATRVLHQFGRLATLGVPNYFDDQRFGSVSFEGEFIAKKLVLGQFEEALKQALTAPYEHDRASDKQEKRKLRDLWGRWPEAQRALGQSHARSLVSYLAQHPEDFRGAVARYQPDLASLYLSAYQSELWNQVLNEYLAGTIAATDCVSLETKRHGLLAPNHPERLPADWASLQLPLPSARWRPDPADPRLPIYEKVFAAEGFAMSAMKIPGLDRPYFSRGDRAGSLWPADSSAETIVDDRHPQKFAAVLSFELPRGSYATMIVKRVMA